MTDELKAKFQALVKDAPEPTGLPSDAVFARIKTVRRRRTTGLVAGLATAAVATIALAAGNLTGIDSAPPVTETPDGPTPTAMVPTSTPTSTPTGPKSSIAVTAETLEPGNQETDTGEGTGTPPPTSPSSPKTETPEAPGPVKISLSLTPKVQGLKLTVTYRWTGSLLTPIDSFSGKTATTGSSLPDNSFNWDYDFGDGRYDPPTGKLGGGLTCEGANERVSGTSTGQTQTHTYLKPGTYTFSYVITYCGPNGEVPMKKTLKVKIDGPTSSATP
ncbi:hypothetical protein [Kribbella lupini]|uniref:PKD domain-containing protein n=1 Tax=Kribbella lupini TaxID=291602 RepID=A0ABP4MPX7_9ACTN